MCTILVTIEQCVQSSAQAGVVRKRAFCPYSSECRSWDGWIKLTETDERCLLVEQARFAEVLIVAEAYDLNQSAEWVPVLWNQILQSSRIDQFLNDFVAVLPIAATMLMELARFYRAEVSARGYQMDFTKWLLTPGAVPMELSRHLEKIHAHSAETSAGHPRPSSTRHCAWPLGLHMLWNRVCNCWTECRKQQGLWFLEEVTVAPTFLSCRILTRLPKPYIGCPCPWVLGGHGCDVSVHG